MKAGFVASAERTTARQQAVADQRPARQEVRISLRVACRVTLYDPETRQSTALIGRTINVSSTGFAIQLNRLVPSGTWIEALVPRHTGDPMFVCGTVVHARRVLADTYEMGVEFDGQTPPSVF
ncbi:MAG: PilZ domain-containing protein [Phycisphaerae bacterium]|jgi:hypothetical protein